MHDPRVPETLEGWSVLHQMFRIRWPEWRVRPEDLRHRLAAEAAEALAAMRRGEAGTTVPVTLLGHKGDLMLVHLRRSFEELQAAQVAVARLGLSTFLEPTTSFVSVVELGMYEMTAQIHKRLGERGLVTGSDGVRGRVRRGDGGAEKARRGPPLGRGAGATARLLLPHEQAPGRASRTGTPSRSRPGRA